MRNKFIDNLKGIGIFLVVFGHCIQCGTGKNIMMNNLFFSNKLFRFIYTFHMPFFMLISGYLFYNSIKKHSSVKIVKSKVNRCLVPILIWTIGGGIITNILNKQDINIFSILGGFFDNFNFLWAIFYASILALAINKVYNDSLVGFMIIIIASNFLYIPSLYFSLYLLPFFIIGYLFNKYQNKFQKFLNFKYLSIIFILLSLIFFKLFHYFTVDKYIYTSSYFIGNNIHNLYINIYRFIIGLVGSILAILSIKVINKLLEKIKIFEILGHNSLAIYIISYYINYLFLVKYTANFSLNYLVVFGESICILIICTIITWILRKNKYTKKYLLGE